MSKNVLQFLQTRAMTQNPTTQSYDFYGQKVWLKRASKPRSTWSNLPLQWLSKLLGLHLLAPARNYGGTKAIATELKRLEQLHAHGIVVPEILANIDSAILLKDLAEPSSTIIPLDQALAQLNHSAERLALYAKAIQAIEYVHTQGSYLSKAFARNIFVNEQHHFSFVDFETDPADNLSLTQCQTRDWLFFIFSTAKYFDQDDISSAQQLLFQTLQKHPKIYKNLRSVGKNINWIIRFKPQSFGHDGHRLNKSIRLLNGLNHSS